MPPANGGKLGSKSSVDAAYGSEGLSKGCNCKIESSYWISEGGT